MLANLTHSPHTLLQATVPWIQDSPTMPQAALQNPMCTQDKVNGLAASKAYHSTLDIPYNLHFPSSYVQFECFRCFPRPGFSGFITATKEIHPLDLFDVFACFCLFCFSSALFCRFILSFYFPSILIPWGFASRKTVSDSRSEICLCLDLFILWLCTTFVQVRIHTPSCFRNTHTVFTALLYAFHNALSSFVSLIP